jgi:hypothetical protein
MRFKKVVFFMLLGVIFKFLGATEFRSPLIVENGPMRYVFEEWEESDYGLKIWTSCYGRESHKAFLSHGTNTHPLSALFFNKSNFLLTDAFPNSEAEIGTEQYSPFLGITRLNPVVTYSEKGISLGARFAYPVYKNKGRIGLRAQVPFRKIEIEREDFGDKDTNQLDDLLTGEVVTRGRTAGGTQAKDVFARAVRMDFVQSIPFTDEGKTLLDFDTSTGEAQLVGVDAGWVGTQTNRRTAIIQSPEGTVPRKPARLLGVHENPIATSTTPTPDDLPANGVVTDVTKQYKFVAAGGTNYSSLDIHEGTGAAKALAKSKASQLWLTSVHADGSGGPSFSTGSNNFWTAFDLLLKNYNENAFEWLDDRGFEFASETRSGIGDIDLDLFYEHQFCDHIIAEIMLGVRFPTGGSSDYCRNPYRPHLGNGSHWEIKGGLLFVWQPLTWLNIRLDGKYAFVLEGSEKRMAAFKGASVKNIGPCTDADVDWEYFDGHLDFNLFHPKTDAISTIIGYEFYYKTTDNIDYKSKSIEHWLGKKFESGSFKEKLYDLDSSVAESNTQAIAHRIRLETSFRITRYFEIFCGAIYTFAGRNIPRECDGHGGFVVTF